MLIMINVIYHFAFTYDLSFLFLENSDGTSPKMEWRHLKEYKVRFLNS